MVILLRLLLMLSICVDASLHTYFHSNFRACKMLLYIYIKRLGAIFNCSIHICAIITNINT